MRTIYIDVLILLNLYVTYFLLKAAARLTHTALKTARLVPASICGALSSLTILLPDGGAVFSLLLKLPIAAVITYVAFGAGSVRDFIGKTAVFLSVNFLFAGVMLALWITLRPKMMYYSNGVVYFDFSLLSVCVSTIAAYCGVSLFRLFLDKRAGGGDYSMVVLYGGRSAEMPALPDTGNGLTDPLTGLPVVICPQTSLSGILSEAPPRERLLPYYTVSGGSMMRVFRPSGVRIKNLSSKRIKSVDVIVGICEEDMESAVFNPKILD